MAVTYVIEFRVRDDQRARFTELLTGVLDRMREENNFVSAALSVDPDDRLHFLLHETWADHQDVVDTQLARSYRDDWHRALPEMLAEDRKVTIWSPLRAD